MLDDFIFYPHPSFDPSLYNSVWLQALPPLVVPPPPLHPGARSITLLPELQSFVTNTGIGGFTLRLTATDPVRMDPKIFVYLAKPVAPSSDTATVEFQRVCSPDDLAGIPADAPEDGANPPYLRLDFVELVFYSRAEAIEVRDAIAEDVGDLMQALLDAEDLDPGEPIVLTLG